MVVVVAVVMVVEAVRRRNDRLRAGTGELTDEAVGEHMNEPTNFFRQPNHEKSLVPLHWVLTNAHWE